MDYKDIQQNIEQLERELFQLKTIQGAIKSATGYTYTYTHNVSEPQEQVDVVLEVTYSSGDGEILSAIYNNFVVPLKIENNKQKAYFRILNSGAKVVISSSRPVVSVVMVSHA